MGRTTTVITTCDRCGKIIESSLQERHWKIFKKQMYLIKDQDSRSWNEKSEYILCTDCYYKLKDWLKSAD